MCQKDNVQKVPRPKKHAPRRRLPAITRLAGPSWSGSGERFMSFGDSPLPARLAMPFAPDSKNGCTTGLDLSIIRYGESVRPRDARTKKNQLVNSESVRCHKLTSIVGWQLSGVAFAKSLMVKVLPFIARRAARALSIFQIL